MLLFKVGTYLQIFTENLKKNLINILFTLFSGRGGKNYTQGGGR